MKPRQGTAFARHAAILAAVAVLGGCSSCDRAVAFAQGEPPRGAGVTVERVLDGDTLVVVAQDGRRETVRLLGIDTPELSHPARPEEYGAVEARDRVRSRVEGRTVRLEADPLREDRDKYDRLLRYVWLPDGTLLNAELVREGAAFAFTRYAFSRQEEFVELQRRAREKGRGVWKDGGLAEVRWNLGRGRSPVRLHVTGDRSFAVQFGPWIKTHVRGAKLRRELDDLIRWTAEFEGRGLEARLAEAGYVRFNSREGED